MKKKLWIPLIIILVMVAAFIIIRLQPRKEQTTAAGPEVASGVIRLELGKPVEVLKEMAPSGKDTAFIIAMDCPVIGLELEVPEGSYSKDTDCSISYREITHYNGSNPYFTPATPLIQIDNGGEYANKDIRITVPVKIQQDEFAMGFYYDEGTGELEGIPQYYQDGSKVVLATRHFSNIVVSVVKKVLLLEEKNVATNFNPGVDDWHFVNRGSFATPEGECAGQSLSALWYYKYKKLCGNPALYGLLDNNGVEKTPGFWYDDALGYRLVSSVQRDNEAGDIGIFNEDLEEIKPEDLLRDTEDECQWISLRNAMLSTGRPQFLCIEGKDEKNKYVGHAVIVYAIKDNRIFLADPNYPGKKDLFFTYENYKFSPYHSGTNAVAIERGDGIVFDAFNYAGEFSEFDKNKIAERWEEIERKDMENEFFPYPMIVAEKGMQLSEREFPFKIEYNDMEAAKQFYFRVCRWDDKTWMKISGKEKNPVYDLSKGYLMYTVDQLKEGSNRLGFYFSDKDDNWAAFQWIDVFVDSKSSSPTEKTSVETETTKVPESSSSFDGTGNARMSDILSKDTMTIAFTGEFPGTVTETATGEVKDYLIKKKNPSEFYFGIQPEKFIWEELRFKAEESRTKTNGLQTHHIDISAEGEVTEGIDGFRWIVYSYRETFGETVVKEENWRFENLPFTKSNDFQTELKGAEAEKRLVQYHVLHNEYYINAKTNEMVIRRIYASEVIEGEIERFFVRLWKKPQK